MLGRAFRTALCKFRGFGQVFVPVHLATSKAGTPAHFACMHSQKVVANQSSLHKIILIECLEDRTEYQLSNWWSGLSAQADIEQIHNQTLDVR